MPTLAEVRARAIAAQGYATRHRRADATAVQHAIRRLSCVQLDSISTVDRSHRIVLATRVGAYPEGAVSELLASGKVFEYWAHEACLIPIEDLPLFRRRMPSGARTTGGATSSAATAPSPAGSSGASSATAP